MEKQYIEQARFNMVEQQIRPAEVLDPTVLELIATTHRENFVPKPYMQLAFSDSEIPLNRSEVMMKPIVEARMLQALAIKRQDKILEIGSGCGYVTSLLAKLGQSVVSMEIDPDLAKLAESNLRQAGITNVTLLNQDGSQGCAEKGLYEAIAVTASLPEYNSEIEAQLSIGGRAFMVVGKAPTMEATLITRISENEWQREPLFETVLPPMRNILLAAEFVF